MGVAKKLLIVLLIVFFNRYVWIQLGSLVFVLVLVFSMTLVVRPHQLKFLFLLKAFCDLLQTALFILLLESLRFSEETMFSTAEGAPTLNEEDIAYFNKVGWSILSIVFLFNSVCLIKLVFGVTYIFYKLYQKNQQQARLKQVKQQQIALYIKAQKE